MLEVMKRWGVTRHGPQNKSEWLLLEFFSVCDKMTSGCCSDSLWYMEAPGVSLHSPHVSRFHYVASFRQSTHFWCFPLKLWSKMKMCGFRRAEAPVRITSSLSDTQSAVSADVVLILWFTVMKTTWSTFYLHADKLRCKSHESDGGGGPQAQHPNNKPAWSR